MFVKINTGFADEIQSQITDIPDDNQLVVMMDKIW